MFLGGILSRRVSVTTQEESLTPAFPAMVRNFLKGMVINAIVIAPISAINDWATNAQATEGIEAFRKMGEIVGKAFGRPFLSSLLSSSIVIYGIAIVIFPILEELFFRGVVQYRLQKVAKDFLSKNTASHGSDEKIKRDAAKISRVVSSIIFGLAHLLDQNVVGVITIGISSYFMESKAYEEDGLAGSIGMHAGNNAMCALLDRVFSS